MRRAVALACACLYLVSCSDDAQSPEAGSTAATSPTVTPQPPPSAVPEPPEAVCPNQTAVVADESLQTEGAVAGDVDGDGTEEVVSIFFDPSGADGCQAFVVAHSGEEIVAAGPLESWSSDFGLPMPTLNSLRDVDGEPGLEVVVNMGAGASTQFVGIAALAEGAFSQVTSAAAGEAGGLFGVGGSVGHLEAVDCAPDGRVVASFAAPAGDRYRVERRFLVFSGTELVEDAVEVSRVPLGQINDFPEYASSPFGSCSD
jgi:hypothetical protein